MKIKMRKYSWGWCLYVASKNKILYGVSNTPSFWVALKIVGKQVWKDLSA